MANDDKAEYHDHPFKQPPFRHNALTSKSTCTDYHFVVDNRQWISWNSQENIFPKNTLTSSLVYVSTTKWWQWTSISWSEVPWLGLCVIPLRPCGAKMCKDDNFVPVEQGERKSGVFSQAFICLWFMTNEMCNNSWIFFISSSLCLQCNFANQPTIPG